MLPNSESYEKYDESFLSLVGSLHNEDHQVRYVCLGLVQLPIAIKVLRSTFMSDTSVETTVASVGSCAILYRIEEMINMICDEHGGVKLSYNSAPGVSAPLAWTSLVTLLLLLRGHWDQLNEECRKEEPVSAKVLQALLDVSEQIANVATAIPDLQLHLAVQRQRKDYSAPSVMLRYPEVTTAVISTCVAAMTVASWALHDGIALPIIITCLGAIVSALLWCLLPHVFVAHQPTTAHELRVVRGPESAPTHTDRPALPLIPTSTSTPSRAVVTICVDSKRHIVRWNSSAKAVLGWDFAEVKGKPLAALLEDNNMDSVFDAVGSSSRSLYAGWPMSVLVKPTDVTSTSKKPRKNLMVSAMKVKGDDMWVLTAMEDTNERGRALEYVTCLGQYLLREFDHDAQGAQFFMAMIPEIVEGTLRCAGGTLQDYVRAKFPTLFAAYSTDADVHETYYDHKYLDNVVNLLSIKESCIEQIGVDECDEEDGKMFARHFQIRVTLTSPDARAEVRDELLAGRCCVFCPQDSANTLIIIVPAQKLLFSQTVVSSRTIKRDVKRVATKNRVATCILVEEPSEELVAENFKLHMEEASSERNINMKIIQYNPAQFQEYMRDDPEKVHCIVARAGVWKSLTPGQLLKLAGVVKLSTYSDRFGDDRSYLYVKLPVTSRRLLMGVVDAVSRTLEQEMNDWFIYDHFERGKAIGNGSAARVYEGHSKLSGARVAIKMFTTGGVATSTREEKTYRILEGRYRDLDADANSTLQAKYILHPIHIKQGFLTLELCHYTLHTAGLSDASLLVCFQQILEGVAFLHTNGIAHRDLKPQNVMLKLSETGGISLDNNKYADVRIIDLGSAVFKESDVFPPPGQGMTMVYAEASTFNSFEECCHGDVWSLGLTAIGLILQGLPPKSELTSTALLKLIKEGNCSSLWEELLSEMICDRAHRKSALELAELLKRRLAQLPRSDP